MPSPFRRARLIPMLGILLCAAAPSAHADPDHNVIQSVRTVLRRAPSPRWTVEVTVFSPRAFDARNEVVHMTIGARDFLYSHAPAGGSLNHLVFQLTPAEWATAKTGERVSVSYGHDADSGLDGDRWDFGPLDKKSLTLLKPVTEIPLPEPLPGN